MQSEGAGRLRRYLSLQTTMKRPKDMNINCISAMLLGSLCSLSAFTPALAQEQTLWWRSHELKPGFVEALAEFNLSPQLLNSDPDKALTDSNDPLTPLYWIRKTLEQYTGDTSGNYKVPVTEGHTNGRNRTSMHGRHGFFTTPVFLSTSQSVEITRTPSDSNITCSAWTIPDFNVPSSLHDELRLPAAPTEYTVTYTASRNGTLLLSCQDPTRDMQNAGKMIPLHVNKGNAQHVPMFIFGITTKEEWKTTLSQQPNPSGEVLLFDGRTRFYMPAKVANRNKNIDIMRLMREHLLMTLVNDRLNGFDSQSIAAPLDLPTPGLINASYAACCSASGGQGLIKINFGGAAVPTSWGYWHEYGHMNQVGWTWGGLSEVTVNLYSVAACRRLQGSYELKDCHPGAAYSDKTWDRESVGNYLKSGKAYNFDGAIEGGDFNRSVMFNQLAASYENLYPQLGKAFRKEFNYADNATAFNTNAKKKDWFVVNASRFSGRDLRSFFDKWGVAYSAEASKTIANMELAQPLQPIGADTRNNWAIAANSASSTHGQMQDGSAKNIAYVAYNINEGPVDLTWADSNYTKLIVPAWDQSNKISYLTFRGTRSNGGCAKRSLNSATGCAQPGYSYWNIEYHPQDNPGLKGNLRGRIQLAARDWKLPAWGAQLDIPFTVADTFQ